MTDALKQKPHIQQVDYIRAIAAMAVAVYHMGGKALPVLNNGWLGVQMFFLLSGFIICWSMPQNYSVKTGWRFILRRIIRIEPPYIISIVLVLIANYIINTKYNPDWADVAGHLAYINSITGRPYLSAVYWTLGIEFQFYLFVALFFPLIISKWGKWVLLILCVIPLCISIPGNGLFNTFPLFALGINYYLYLSKRINLTLAGIFGSLFTIASVITIGRMATGSGLFALLLLMLPLQSNRIVSFLSKISFSLYLTHDVIGSNWVVYVGEALPKTLFYKGVEFISGIAISILFAYGFYKLVEAPFLRWSKKVSYK